MDSPYVPRYSHPSWRWFGSWFALLHVCSFAGYSLLLARAIILKADAESRMYYVVCALHTAQPSDPLPIPTGVPCQGEKHRQGGGVEDKTSAPTGILNFYQRSDESEASSML